jgi:DNA uptake protein ComE-like DNA-binding protein
MAYRNLFRIVLLLVLLIAAACAPADLDITPTAVPTPIPMVKVHVTGAVKEIGKTLDLPIGSRVEDAIKAAGGAADDADLQQINLAQVLRDGQQVNVPKVGQIIEVTAEATEAPPAVPVNQALLDHLLSSVPDRFEAGSIIWTRDKAVETNYVDRDGGVTGRISFNESGGGLLELTLGAFDNADKAKAYYERVATQLERPEERDNFPKPNAFSKGTYGWDGIFPKDKLFIRVSVPRIASTAGDPLTASIRFVEETVDKALGSFKPG